MKKNLTILLAGLILLINPTFTHAEPKQPQECVAGTPIPQEVLTCMRWLNEVDTELPPKYRELCETIERDEVKSIDRTLILTGLSSAIEMLSETPFTDPIDRELQPIICNCFEAYRADVESGDLKRGSNSNGRYLNLGVTHALRAGSLTVDTSATIGGNLKVAGSADIGGDLTVSGTIKSDIATGSGVFAASNFSTNNALLRVDLPNGQKNIKQSGVTIDNSDNMSGVETLTAITVNANTVTGDFIGNLTGAASLNVLKAGDTMTGNLNMAAESELRLQDASGGQYVGLNAPATVTSSYTVGFPGTAPTVSQILVAGGTSPLELEWITPGGDPSVTRTYYVSKSGDDGNVGTFEAPLLTIAKALDLANAISIGTAPTILIEIGNGVFTENNSGSALAITRGGITLNGSGLTTTTITPSTLSNDLFSCTPSSVSGVGEPTTIFKNCTLDPGTSGSTASGINFSSSAAGTFTCDAVSFVRFATGVTYDGVNAVPLYLINNCQFRENDVCIRINAARGVIKSNSFIGSLVAAGDTGVVVTGAGTLCIHLGNSFLNFDTAASIADSGRLRIVGCYFGTTINTIISTGGRTDIVGSVFVVNAASSINIAASGTGTTVNLASSDFSCATLLGAVAGIAIKATTEAVILANGISITNAVTAVQSGALDDSDTSSTKIICNGVLIEDCTNDIIQSGTATLVFTSGSAATSKLSVHDTTNVTFAYFDQEDSNILKIGKTDDQNTMLLEALTGASENPSFEYRTALYSTQAIGYENTASSPTKQASLFCQSANDVTLTGVTTDRTQTAGVRLVSDTASPVGGVTALRGWDIAKAGTTADLTFDYQNTDSTGQLAVTQFTIMQLDGLNNEILLPDNSTKMIFGASPNTADLYRSGSGILTIDDNLIVSGLTINRAVATDGSKTLISSATTATQLEFLSTTTSNVQTQLDAKVDIAGDTMTGSLVLPPGSTASPSLNFTGSVTSGLSAASNALSLSSNAVERINIASGGIVKITNLAGTAGIVHSDSSGNLTNTLIFNDDITDTTIANGKLATQSSANTAGNIVVRDGSGNFATNRITGLSTPSAGTDAANKDYVDASGSTGIVPHEPAKAAGTGNVVLASTGLTSIDGVTLFANDRVLLKDQTTATENGVYLAQTTTWVGNRGADFALTTSAGSALFLVTDGTANGGSSWLCSTPDAVIGTDDITFEQIGLGGAIQNGANVGTGAGQVFRDKTGSTLNFKTIAAGTHVTVTNNANDITLATDAVSANTVSTIVARDGSGDFSAGTITASLTGLASLNVATNGGTMTGDLQLPAGATATPSLKFTGSTTTGLSASSDALSLSSNAVERINIGSTGTISIPAFTTSNAVVLANGSGGSSGALSAALIATANISPTAAIANTQLATQSSANTSGNIVVRDGSGDFAAGAITATSFNGPLIGDVTGTVTGTASGNLALTGGTLTGALVLPASVAGSPQLQFTGNTTTGLSVAGTSNKLSFNTSAAERMSISSAGTVQINSLAGTAGIVHNDSSGNLTSSLIVDVDVASDAAIADSKLGPISTPGKVANGATTALITPATPATIVLRGAGGGFTAGPITATSFINAVGTTALPSYTFTGDTDTGMSAPTANNLHLSTAGSPRLSIDAAGNVTYSSNYKVAAYASALQILVAGTETIEYDTELFDLNSNFNTTTFTYTAPVTGYYAVSAQVNFAASGNGTRSIQLVKNGTPQAQYISSTSAVRNNEEGPLTQGGLIQLTATDTLSVQFTGNTGDVIAANESAISIYFVSS